MSAKIAVENKIASKPANNVPKDAPKAEKILITTTAGNGQPHSYLSTDKQEVTAMTVEIPPGADTSWHLEGLRCSEKRMVLAWATRIGGQRATRADFKAEEQTLADQSD